MTRSTASPRPARRLTPLKVIGWLVVGAALIFLLVMQGRALILFAQRIPLMLDDPYTLNYGEGPLLDQAVRLARGEDIYRADLSTPPYTITNYPPLYVMAQVPFVNHFGAALWYGRLISLISAGAAALFLGLTVQTVTKDWLAGLAAGLTLPAIPYIFYWSSLARIDCLALALSMAGLWVIARWYQHGWGIILAALLLTAAAYTRQTYLLAAPLAAVGWLWGRRERFGALAFAVLVGCFVLGIFAVLMVATRGGIFFHVITANVNALDTTLIQHYVDELIQHLPILLAGGALYLVLGAIWGRRAWWLIAPYTVGGALVALTISKVGSDVNYLFELSAGVCFAAGGLIALVRRWFPLRAAALVVLALAVSMATDLTTRHYEPLLRDRAEDQGTLGELIAVIRSTDAPILADEDTALLVLNGKPILIQPFEMSQLALAGLWDQQPFLDALARGDYPVILLYQLSRSERWTPHMRAIINNVYRPDFQSGGTMVYRYVGQ
ncbi:MAG: hypothetical protein IT319_01985 [Anaerolineae bacterium]|nr:hypothetical protein [Anaerolineae bacterium]